MFKAIVREERYVTHNKCERFRTEDTLQLFLFLSYNGILSESLQKVDHLRVHYYSHNRPPTVSNSFILESAVQKCPAISETAERKQGKKKNLNFRVLITTFLKKKSFTIFRIAVFAGWFSTSRLIGGENSSVALFSASLISYMQKTFVYFSPLFAS